MAVASPRTAEAAMADDNVPSPDAADDHDPVVPADPPARVDATDVAAADVAAGPGPGTPAASPSEPSADASGTERATAAIGGSATPASGDAPSGDAPSGDAPSGDAPSGTSGHRLGARHALAITDARGVVQSVDPPFSDLLGWAPEEIVGRRLGELVRHEDLPRGLASWSEMLGRPGPAQPVRVRYRHRDGRWMWLEITSHNRLRDPSHGDVLTEIVDVSTDTRETAAMEALRSREQMLAQATEAAPLGLFHVDTEGRMLFANGCLVDITGIAGAATLKDQLAVVVDRDRAGLVAALQAASGGIQNRVEIGICAPNGEIRFSSLSLRPLRDVSGAVVGITGCLQDITNMVSSRRAVETRAMTDPLTGCLTREATLTMLDALVQLQASNGGGATTSSPDGRAVGGRDGGGDRRGGRRGMAVLLLDVDGMRSVNEHHGTAAGDEVLALVALRIRDSVRSSDVIGRVGGDEFVVLCGGVPGATTAVTIGRSILERVCQPAELKAGGSVPVRARMGVVWTSQADVPATRLVGMADDAMRTARQARSDDPVLSEMPAA
jgi:diguanylate cyclase (GGDEF)-like protein/PAS domain S-box-containing protein